MNLRLIFGIMLFGNVIILPFLLLFYLNRKKKKYLDKMIEIDPSLRQKLRIIK